MGQFSVEIRPLPGSVPDGNQQQILDAFITELEARLASEGDQAIGEKTTTECLDWAKNRAMELDPFADGLAGLFRDVQRP